MNYNQVRDHFRLTRVESEIAVRVAAGQSPKEIARETRRSVETVRNQLKTIFEKTETHSQLQLAVKILRGD
jgi:DNA-binding CsgD family transcriptional regulator